MTGAKVPASLASIIKSARDVMRKDAGLNGDADRIPQIAWLMFLKALDDLEESREIVDPGYEPALAAPYRWRDWAAGSTSRRSGEALLRFVEDDLLPHLAELSGSGEAGDTRDALGQIFRDTRNRMLSGYLLAELVDKVDRISFRGSDDVHTMAHLYESMLREMRDAAGDAGEFYTPRPVIRFMVGRLDPRPGETVMDPAVGTGGFLVEAWEYVVRAADSSPMPAHERARLEGTFRGFEKKPMPFLLGQMNLLLHGVDDPRITRGNALTFSAAEQRRDGVDVVLTNPPFGGEEESGVKEYFPSDRRTAETSWLFLQSVMERISRSRRGRAAVVVPNGVLFDGGVGAKIKKKLLAEFDLHTIVRLPNGVFSPYTLIPTNILFFERGGPTKDIWFYQHPLPEGRKNYTKTKPLRYEEFAGCEAWWGADRPERGSTSQAWKVSAADVAAENYNLDVSGPPGAGDLSHRPPHELLAKLAEATARFEESLSLAQSQAPEPPPGGLDHRILPLGDVVTEAWDHAKVVDSQEYRTAGVRKSGGGLFWSGIHTSESTKYSALNRMHAGQIIYSKLKAFEGAVARVSSEFEGAFTSHEFPTFDIREDLVDADYLYQLVISEAFVDCMARRSKGVGARRERLPQEQFLSIRIPVPPITTQREIAERLKSFDRIAQVGVDRHIVESALPLAARHSIFAAVLQGSN